jgi:SAM-dependent methyltransferase
MFGPRHEHRLGYMLRESAKLPPGSRILEAAVGLGQLAERLRRQGHRVFGIDGSFEAARHSRGVVGDLTRLPFRGGVFDGVTSGETLEHLDDDASAAAEIGRVLKPAGLCIVTVPALEILRTESDTYYEHRRRYSRRTLTDLFRGAGFVIQRARYWGFPVVLAYDYLFMLPMNYRRRKHGGSLPGVARAGRSRLLVNVVRGAFSIDRLFSIVPFGPGLIMVAKRR